MRSTVLIVPPELKADVNPSSGFLSPDSPFAGKNAYGLFLSPPNQAYLARELAALLGNLRFVGATLAQAPLSSGLDDAAAPTPFAQLDRPAQKARASLLVSAFHQQGAFLRDRIYSLMREFYGPLNGPHREDSSVANPLLQLHLQNRQFLLETARNLVLSPEQVVPGWLDINPETGRVERPEYDYSAASWQDGTWHPEHLFSQSARNRNNPYWVPLSVDFDSRAGTHARGPGHRFNSPVYGTVPGARDEAGDPATFSQFPRWQWSADYRAYSGDQSALREGGSGDRRVQRPRGYDMTALTSKSTY